jgi:hypothetical protein
MIYYKNVVYYFDVSLIDTLGNFVSGEIVTYKVYLSSTNDLIISDTMTEIGSSGIYRAEITFANSGQYRIEYYTPVQFKNGVETIIVEEIELQSIGENIIRILGLSQENYRIFNPTYITKNNQACMTSAIIKIYNSALDCENDTNVLATYTIAATFDSQARMLTYKVKKV